MVSSPTLMETQTHFRRGGRRTVALRVAYRGDGALVRYAKTHDISTGGAFLETEHRPPVEAKLVLELESPSTWEPLAVEAKVCWLRDDEPQGFGVMFEGLSPRDSLALSELLVATDMVSDLGGVS